MQISCPQCATVYDLDERVLPPGGAPVQCTRCSHVFTASPSSSEAAPATGGTKIFGMPKFDDDPSDADDPEPPKERTRIYGGPRPGDVAPPSAPAPAKTQVFGAQSEPQPEVRATQIFGVPAVQPEGAKPDVRSTQIFGAPGSQPPSPSQTPARGTQIFGAPAMPQPPSQPASQPPQTPARGTQIFGAPAMPPQQPDVRSTQIFGAPQAGKDPLRSTQIFGAPTPSSPQPAVPREPERATPKLGMPAFKPEATQPEPPARPVDPLRQTQIFGKPPPAITPQTLQMPSFAAATPAEESSGDARPASADENGTLPPRSTPMFGSPAVGSRPPGTPPPPFSPPSFAQMDDAVLPPPKRMSVSEQLEDDPGAALRRARRRRTGLTLTVLGLLALVAAGYAVYRQLASRKTPPPEEAIAAHSEALRALRRDDLASLRAAEAQLEQVTTQWPDFAEARVTQLAAVLFQLEDVKIRIERVTEDSNARAVEIQRLKERQEPADWENRVNALVDEVAALKAEGDPLVEEATALDARVNALRRNLQTGPSPLHPDDEVQLVRGQALYAGVKGSDQVLVLAERYRNLGGTDGWGEVAHAEYALNARVAPETRRQARAALETLRGTDSAWTRLYVMVGRLALRDSDFDAAVTSFESALTLNPQHHTAKRLLEQARKKRAAASAQP